MKIGFYGGKFLPMHKGHLYCIDVASKMCDHLVVIMFINGDEELNAIKGRNDKELTVKYREEQVKRACSLYPNAEFHIVDVASAKFADGSENWDAETPLVRQYLPKIDFVFSSESRYENYFNRAYPEATHIIIDEKRKKYPISSTMIRNMKEFEEKNKWIF